MKKILVFTSTFGKPFFGGAERSVFEFYKYLTDFNIVICTLDKEYAETSDDKKHNHIKMSRYATLLPHPFVERDSMNKYQKFVTHFLNMFVGIKPSAVLKEILKHNPELVITHNLSGWGYLPWILSRFFRIPIIHDNHDQYLTCFRTSRWKPGKGNCTLTCIECIPRQLATQIFWKRGVMIANSEFLKNEIRKVINNKKTLFEVVYPPIQIQNVYSVPLRKKYDVVYVGRLEKSKGVREFLLATRSKKLVIGVAGEGELRAQLELEFPDVNFLGETDGQELMRNSKLLVVPSLLNETYGRVALEGVAAGIPIIISARGGLPEFKERDGAVIMEVDPENLDDFARKIDKGLIAPQNSETIKKDWLEEHYENQIRKFSLIVNKSLSS